MNNSEISSASDCEMAFCRGISRGRMLLCPQCFARDLRSIFLPKYEINDPLPTSEARRNVSEGEELSISEPSVVGYGSTSIQELRGFDRKIPFDRDSLYPPSSRGIPMSDWAQRHWFDLSILVLQGAVLATVVWYGSKILRFLEAFFEYRDEFRRRLSATIDDSEGIETVWRDLKEWLQAPIGSGGTSPLRTIMKWLLAHRTLRT